MPVKKPWYEEISFKDIIYIAGALFTACSMYFGLKEDNRNLANQLVLINYRLDQVETKNGIPTPKPTDKTICEFGPLPEPLQIKNRLRTSYAY